MLGIALNRDHLYYRYNKWGIGDLVLILSRSVYIVPTAVGDVVQLAASGDYLGQRMENIFMYRIEDTPSETWYTGLFEEFRNDVLGHIRSIQCAEAHWTRLKVINLFSFDETYEEAIALNGTLTCDANNLEPSNLALYFTLQRSNARVQNGAKYIGGLTEGVVGGNTVQLIPAQYNPVEDALSATLTAGLTDEFAPVLVKRIRDVVFKPTALNPTNQVYRYRLPQTQTAMDDNWSYIRAAQMSLDISHMDSRQKGHGI